MDKKTNIIIEIIDDVFDNDTIITYWNYLAGHYADGMYSMIYNMDNLDIVLKNEKPSDIIAAIDRSEDFYLKEKYFMYGKVMGLKSFDFVTANEICYETLAEYLVTNKPEVFDKHKDYMVNGFIDSYQFFNCEEAHRVLTTMIAFGYINMVKDDWDTLYNMVSSLMKEK